MNTGSVPRRAARPHNTPVSSVTTPLAGGRQESPEGSKLSENSACKRRGRVAAVPSLLASGISAPGRAPVKALDVREKRERWKKSSGERGPNG